MMIDDVIFLNVFVCCEGFIKFGVDNCWGIFFVFGVGVDVNCYLDINNVDFFKVWVGYGVIGVLFGLNGLFQFIC